MKMITMQDWSMPGTVLMDRLEEILSLSGEDILDKVGTGHVSAAPYETAWVARIRDPGGEVEFPKTIDWLRANQREDGSWGSDVFHEYDRYINTLAATIALKEWGGSPAAVAKGEAYLSEAVHRLEGSQQGIASDHILGMLHEEAARVGVSIPYEHNPHKHPSQLKRTLLSYRLVDEEHPLSFFAEILGRIPNHRRTTRRLQARDGSIASSASATASSIVFDGNPVHDHSHYGKLRYLKDAMLPDGGVRHFWDIHVMEMVYGLYHLKHVKRYDPDFGRKVRGLEQYWLRDGLGLSRHFYSPDLDDTALGYILLTTIGREPDPRVFDRYWRGEYFVTQLVHDKGDAGPNIHSLEALSISSHPERDRLMDATIKFLRRCMVDGDHFIDKWNLSPAYNTCHAIFALHLTEETLMERCVSFFQDTQHEDGSWGFIDNGNGLGTLEETAFALMGLLYYHQNVEPIDTAQIDRGVEYVLANHPSVEHPSMWMAKVLYTPGIIVESAIVTALLMYKQAMGGDVHGYV